MLVCIEIEGTREEERFLASLKKGGAVTTSEWDLWKLQHFQDASDQQFPLFLRWQFLGNRTGRRGRRGKERKEDMNMEAAKASQLNYLRVVEIVVEVRDHP